jgi:hypothetical protein
MGVTMKVFSGGQDAEGSRRTGSHRHDGGNAADVFFYKDGRQLDWANPQDLPIFEDIVRRGHQAGITGFGAGEGYMRPGSMHIGFGAPAVWGAGGSGRNAPEWLRMAYGSDPGPTHGPGLAALVNHVPQSGSATQAADNRLAAPPLPPPRQISDAPVAAMGSPAPQGQTQPQSAPQSILSALTGKGSDGSGNSAANYLAMLGSMSPEPQQMPAPPPIQGPSPEQANALSSLVQALMQKRMV